MLGGTVDVEVSPRRSVPLERPLGVRHDGDAVLLLDDDGGLLAEARPPAAEVELTVPDTPTPDASVGGPDGQVRDEVIWTALDCPGGVAAVEAATVPAGTRSCSVWGRTPGTLAMTAATLHRLSGGRFVLGLGPSTRALVEGFHDVRFAHPADKLRGVTIKVRALLAGERALLDATPGSRPLRLGQPAAPDLPIWLAAMGDRHRPGRRRARRRLVPRRGTAARSRPSSKRTRIPLPMAASSPPRRRSSSTSSPPTARRARSAISWRGGTARSTWP